MSLCVQSVACILLYFVFRLGESLLDVVVRPYITRAVCGDTWGAGGVPDISLTSYNVTAAVSTPDVCLHMHDYPEVETEVFKKAAAVLVAHRVLGYLPGVLWGPFCGAWSDHRGRKLPMMLPSVGSCLAVLLYIISAHAQHAKVALLLTGSTIHGVFGKTPIFNMAINSHVSDSSKPEERTSRLGRLLAGCFLGTFTGSLLGGLLQDLFGVPTVLCFVSGVHALCVFFVLLGVQESLSQVYDQQQEMEAGSSEEQGSVRGSVTTHPHSSENGHILKGNVCSSEMMTTLNSTREEGLPFARLENYELDTAAEGTSLQPASASVSDNEGSPPGKVLSDDERLIPDKGQTGCEGNRGSKEAGLLSRAALRESVMTVCRSREGDRRLAIIIILVALALHSLCKTGNQDVTVLFVQNPPLSWSPSLYSYLTAMEYGAMGLALMVLLPVLSGPLHLSDLVISMVGIVFSLLGSLGMCFSSHTWMVFVSQASKGVGGLYYPALRSLLTKMVDITEIGKIFSIAGTLETVSRLLASFIFTGLYAVTLDTLPATVYLLGSALLSVMFVVVLYLWFRLRKPVNC